MRFVNAGIHPHTSMLATFLVEPFVVDASDTSTKLLSEGQHCDSDLRDLSVSILASLFMQTCIDQSGGRWDFLSHPPINYTAFINTGLMNGPCKKGELRGGVNTAPACTHVATY